ncbi:hypothetical protein K458DRAFT_437682 [Lentithecium fluviatile CBS 122367]|uniref:Rhodopsin domain-containing protein n=1 Tax=Lentithecium fluviatile CBS 122367 TaxID=1168545 RepID=A0A6G1ICZ5_9PLEO|nr:hypothetical protein K458DRAFT_437682 [Lentithecium fluviatile CBS 122367]
MSHSPPSNAPFQKSDLVSQTLYSLAALFIKITLLVLYLRMFHPTYRANTMIWVGIVDVSLAYVAFAIAFIIIFTPPPVHQEQWGLTRSAAKTTALLKSTAVNGVFVIVSDFYILLIPMHLVMGLHLPLGRKLGVCGIFLTGLRIVELNVGLIYSCLPVLFVFFKRIAKSDSYASLVRYFRKRRSDGRYECQNNHAGQRKDSDEIQLSNPKPTMIGLRSFIRKANKSQPQQSFQIDSYNELDNVNDDYHAQLKGAKRVGKNQDLA